MYTLIKSRLPHQGNTSSLVKEQTPNFIEIEVRVGASVGALRNALYENKDIALAPGSVDCLLVG
jgi:hypothetical protein